MKPAAEDRPTAAHQLADHLFRHESAKMVAILTGIYGARNLQLAEDVVQEALARAARRLALRHPREPLRVAPPHREESRDRPAPA